MKRCEDEPNVYEHALRPLVGYDYGPLVSKGIQARELVLEKLCGVSTHVQSSISVVLSIRRVHASCFFLHSSGKQDRTSW